MERAPLTATVLPDLTGLDKTFDYSVPEAIAAHVQVGSMVRVPLHGRRVGGWVLRLGPPSAGLDPARLLPIAKWSGLGPQADVVALAEWAAWRWGAARLRPFLVAGSPPSMVRTLPAARASRTAPVTDASEGARTLLADGGGVLRVAPADDLLPVVLAGVERGTVLVVHPAHHGVHELGGRLRAIGRRVAVLPDGWALAASGGADVVIGGRAGAWASVPDLGAVVVLDEHDEALQEERSPTWHAREVAVERARRAGVPCLLVSPCPTVTALAWSGRRWMHPTPADEQAGWPSVEVVDRSDTEPWRRSLLTSPLIEALRDPTRRVVCVHNTPGRARLLACRSCRSLLACEHCAGAVRQLDDATLRCARCGRSRPPVCQRCGSAALANVRPGISRLREEIEAAAGRTTVAVSGTSTAASLDAPIVVGTEAALHRAGRADVVAFLDFDAELLAPRYRAAEQAMALLVRAARLLGPRAAGGRLLVQTFSPDHEVIRAALAADPGLLAKVEGRRRRELGLPPFGALARLIGAEADALATATGLTTAPDGAARLVRAPTWAALADGLAAGRAAATGVRVEVDPPR